MKFYTGLDKANLFSIKLHIFSYPSILTYVLGAQKNCLNETVLLSTHNICLGLEIRNLFFIQTWYLKIVSKKAYIIVIWKAMSGFIQAGLSKSRHGVGDKPMSCKPGVAGSIPGFSIKPLLVEPSGVPIIK